MINRLPNRPRTAFCIAVTVSGELSPIGTEILYMVALSSTVGSTFIMSAIITNNSPSKGVNLLFIALLFEFMKQLPEIYLLTVVPAVTVAMPPGKRAIGSLNFATCASTREYNGVLFVQSLCGFRPNLGDKHNPVIRATFPRLVLLIRVKRLRFPYSHSRMQIGRPNFPGFPLRKYARHRGPLTRFR